ncbi:unnamed protein product, partial [Ceratitis capitata]
MQSIKCFKYGQRGHIAANCNVKSDTSDHRSSKRNEHSFTMLAAAETEVFDSSTCKAILY